MITKKKVLAYIFNSDKSKVLVMDHRNEPHVNPQVPGGTVDEGEPWEEAILREVFEESGLKLKKFQEFVGEVEFRREDIGELHIRRFYSFVLDDLPNSWSHVVTGDGQDVNLIFDYYWMDLKLAKEKLIMEMGLLIPC